MGQRTYLGVFFILLSAVGFGVMPLLAVYAYDGGTNVSTLLFTRFTLAALIFFTVLSLQKRSVRVTGRQALFLFLLGGVFYTAMSMLFFFAVQRIAPSLASLMLNTYPIFVALLAFLIDKEKPSGRLLFALLLSFTGLGLVLGTSFEQVDLPGLLAALGAGMIYSLYIIIGNRVVKQIEPMVTTAYITLFTAASLLLTALGSRSLDYAFGASAWAGIAGIALFSTVLAILMQFKGMEAIGPARASILSQFEPVVTITLAALLLGDRMTPLQMAGGLILLTGGIVVISSRGAKRAASLSEAS